MNILKRCQWIVLLSLLSPIATFASTITVTVNGMVCDFCAQGIHKKFDSDPAVKSIDVSLEKHLVVIETNNGKNLEDLDITSRIKDSGQDVVKIERGSK